MLQRVLIAASLVGALAIAALYVAYPEGLPGLSVEPTVRAQVITQPTAPPAAPFDPERAMLENEQNTVSIVERYSRSVALIQVTQTVTVQHPLAPFGLPPGWEEFFGVPRDRQEQERTGIGSGFVVDSEGHILTNFHVIQGADADGVRVQFAGSDQRYEAQILGRDPFHDLALIRLKTPPADLRPVTLGDSATLRVGQKVIAIGNQFGLEFTVTEGIVSALGRLIPQHNPLATQFREGQQIPDVIQTDAAINRGNSGGPLFNSRGEVIGVNTAILTPSGAFAGVGFAVPINAAKRVLPELMAGRDIETPGQAGLAERRPRLGVSIVGLDAIEARHRTALRLPDRGVLVIRVEPNSPAARAGLKGGTTRVVIDGQEFTLGGDVVLSIDGQAVASAQQMIEIIGGKRPGETVNLRILREGRELAVRVEVELR